MKLRTIAGRKIHPIGLGAMALDEYHPKATEKDAIEFLRYGSESDLGLMDTADVYGLGRNEELIGKALTQEQKEKIIIATKAGCTRPGGIDWDTDGRPEHIKEAVHQSLNRLQIKQIFLYQLHAPDYRVSFNETIKAFKNLQDNGLIKHIGLCNVNLDQFLEAQKIVEIVSVQNHFNLAFKRDENELLPYLTEKSIAFLPYFPLGSGRLLTNKELIEISKKINAAPAQVALAWILSKWPTAIPIPGTKNKKHFEENMKAADVELPENIIQELDALF